MRIEALDNRAYADEIAATLRVTPQTVYSWKARGTHPELCLRAGKNRRVFSDRSKLRGFAKVWFDLDREDDVDAVMAAGAAAAGEQQEAEEQEIETESN